MFGVLSAWLVECMIITYRAYKTPANDYTGGSAPTGNVNTNLIAGLPVPANYTATFVVFGALGALAEVESARTAAGLAAWGFVIATAVNILNPGNPLHPLASAGSSSSSSNSSTSSTTSTTKAA